MKTARLSDAEADAHRVGRTRIWVRLAAVVLGVGASGLAGWYMWFRAGPVPPTIHMAGADPQLVKVVNEARTAVLHAPRGAESWGYLGMVLLQHRFNAEARVCFVRAEQLNPQEARWPYLCAEIDRTDDWPRAIEALERSLAMDEHNATVRLRLAELLLEQGRLDDAERHFQTVLTGGGRTPWEEARAALHLARLALRRDQPAKALEWAQRTEQAVPAMKSPHVLLAEIHLRLGDKPAADREQRKLGALADARWPDPYLEEVERLSVDVHDRIAQARQFLAQGRTAEGLALHEEIAQANPTSAPAWISLGQAHLRLEKWQPAQQALERGLALAPDDAIALADLGFALSRQGQLEPAIAYYHKAIQRNLQNPENYYHLSYCLFRQGRAADAIDALRTAVRLRPHFALAWRELGQILAKHGDPQEARGCLQRALELAPEDEVARKLLDGLR